MKSLSVSLHCNDLCIYGYSTYTTKMHNLKLGMFGEELEQNLCSEYQELKHDFTFIVIKLLETYCL